MLFVLTFLIANIPFKYFVGALYSTSSPRAIARHSKGDVQVGLDVEYESNKGLLGALTRAKSNLIVANTKNNGKIIIHIPIL